MLDIQNTFISIESLILDLKKQKGLFLTGRVYVDSRKERCFMVLAWSNVF